MTWDYALREVFTVVANTEESQADLTAVDLEAPALEDIEHDRELVQRAVNGELTARRAIAELVDPLVNRKSVWLCKRYCRRNRFHSRCTVDGGWGVQEEVALPCEWGTFTVFFLREKLLDVNVLRRYQEYGGTLLAGYLAASISAFGLEEQWKDHRFGRNMSSPHCIENMVPDARRVFWWLCDGESVSTMAFRLGLDEDKARSLIRQVYDVLGKAGLTHVLERQGSAGFVKGNVNDTSNENTAENWEEAPPNRGEVDVHWRNVVLSALDKLSWQERFLLEAMFIERLDDDQILHALRTLNVTLLDGLSPHELEAGSIQEMRNKVLVRMRKLVTDSG